MAEEKNQNSNIALVVAAIVIFAAIIFYAANNADNNGSKTTKDRDTIEDNQNNNRTTTSSEAGKLGTNEIEITAANFEEKVIKSDKLVMIDAYAPWCPHCQKLSPIITELSDDYAGKIVVGKMNADNQDPKTKENFDFAIKNGLTGYPTVWFYKGGKLVESFSGSREKDEIKQIIDKNL